MCVEVPKDDGGGRFIKVILEEVLEAMAMVWDFVIDVDEAEGDGGVVQDVEDHRIEVGDGVVGEEFDPGCYGLLRIGHDLAGVFGAVSGEVYVPHVVEWGTFLLGAFGVGVGSHGGNCIEPRFLDQ